MEELREWSSAVCFAAVGCCAVQLIVPKNGIGKMFRLLVLTFFICSMILPLLKVTSRLSLDVEFLPPETVSEQLQDKVTEQLTRQVQATVKELAAECLSYRSVEAREIVVETDISENGSIYIQQVVIYVDKQNVSAALAVRDALETQLGTTVTVQAQE